PGVHFGVVIVATGIQVTPDPAARAVFMGRLGLAALFYPGRRLAAFGSAAGIPLLDLGPPLQQLAERSHVYLHGFANTPPGEGHWNARGHAAAARLVAGWLCREILERNSPSEGEGGGVPF